MADDVTLPGTGAVVASDDVGGKQFQRIKLTWGPDGTANDADVATGKPIPIQLRGSDGSDLKGRAAAAASVPMALSAEDYATLDGLEAAIANATAAVGAGTAAAATRTVSASDDPNRPRYFSAVATTLTRPANVTPYTANDSISDNATAGSVTALSASVADAVNMPVCVTHVMVDTTDTGLAANVQIRAFLYNSNPTASSGVVGGDNAAFSNKKAGFIGSLSGVFTPFSDGGKAVLVPDQGTYLIAAPTSGAQTLFIQYQTLAAFTPSGNSTTLIGTINGFQGRT